MSMQKNKGNSWERDVAKILTETFGYHFNRNIAGSGNYIGGKNSFRKNVLTKEQLQFCLGDISVPSEMSKMCVECKFYKEFPFHHLLIKKSIPILDSWIQQQLDIVDDDMFWFIAFKINRAGSYIAVPYNKIIVKDDLGNHSIYYYNNEKYIITDLESFLTTYKQDIISACQDN